MGRLRLCTMQTYCCIPCRPDPCPVHPDVTWCGCVGKRHDFEYPHLICTSAIRLSLQCATGVLHQRLTLQTLRFGLDLHWYRQNGAELQTVPSYDFDGTLYKNFPSRLLAGLPWFYYLLLRPWS